MPPKFPKVVCPNCQEDISAAAGRQYETTARAIHGTVYGLIVECPKCLQTKAYELNWAITLLSVKAI